MVEPGAVRPDDDDTAIEPLVYPSRRLALDAPLRWLRAVSRFRAHTTGGPNFGYDLCVRKAKPADLEELDLISYFIITATAGHDTTSATTSGN